MEKCIFLGYPDGYKGWKFYNPSTWHTIILERAELNEELFLMQSKQNPKATENPNINAEQIDTEPPKRKEQTPNNPGDNQEEIPPTPKSDPPPTEEEPIGIRPRLPTWDRQLPKDWWKPWEPTNNHNEDTSWNQDTANSAHKPHGEPKNYTEALEHPDILSWQKAAQEEMTNHLANQTWTLVPHPKERNVIGL